MKVFLLPSMDLIFPSMFIIFLPWKEVCLHPGFPGSSYLVGLRRGSCRGLIICMHLVGGRRVPNGRGPLRDQGTKNGSRAVGKLVEHPMEAVFFQAYTNPMEVNPFFCKNNCFPRRNCWKVSWGFIFSPSEANLASMEVTFYARGGVK